MSSPRWFGSVRGPVELCAVPPRAVTAARPVPEAVAAAATACCADSHGRACRRCDWYRAATVVFFRRRMLAVIWLGGITLAVVAVRLLGVHTQLAGALAAPAASVVLLFGFRAGFHLAARRHARQMADELSALIRRFAVELTRPGQP